MANDDSRRRYSSVPIPTYEEATSSHGPSSQHLGASEASDDHERQAFLGAHASSSSRTSHRRDGYRAPSVRSVRSSQDTLDGIIHSDDDSDENEHEQDDALRRDIEEMEMGDEADFGGSSRARRRGGGGGGGLSKRFGFLRSSWSDMRLPRVSMPSVRWPTWRLPRWKWSVPEHLRPGWQLIARLTGLFIVVGLLYALFVLEIMPNGLGASMFDPESTKLFVQESVDENRIREHLRYITGFNHMAGSEGDLYLAKWVEKAFREAGMDNVYTQEYHVYLNYPRAKGRRVAIVDPPDRHWEAQLEEPNPYQHPTPQQENTLVFHALSRAGNVTGRLVDAGYGKRDSYDSLVKQGVDLNGTVALVRHDGAPRSVGMKIKAAEERGVKGVLMFTDPADRGPRHHQARSASSWGPDNVVQRESVGLTGWIAGDVLTPGTPSIQGTPRISKDNNSGLVNIPSLPLAWADAQWLLKAVKEAPSASVNLVNEQDEVERQPIWNVMGVIEGTEQREHKIVVGNHRDSWCFGAGDPGSGTAVMLEVIRIIGELRNRGWRPLRSIIFASWDAEEYNLIGSTEYVEETMKMLRRDGLAYLNVGAGVTGNSFRAAGSPTLKKALMRVMHRVGDPTRNDTVRDIWQKHKGVFRSLGAEGDFAAFQDMAGIPSLDFGFENPIGPSAHPYHSCYETFGWMSGIGDPGFQYHKALAQIWVLLIIELSVEPLVPFDLRVYAASLKSYVSDLEKFAEGRSGFPGATQFDVKPLHEAARHFEDKANAFHNWDDAWFGSLIANNGFENPSIMIQRSWRNSKLRDFESHLLDIPGEHDREEDGKQQHGIPGREQYKHIVFGPQLWSGDEISYFPAVVDALDAGDWSLAQAQVEKAARILNGASSALHS